MANKVVCVLGMHRSGTSAMTGVLHLLGVSLGEKLLAPHHGVNEFGYFEHTDIGDVHDALFAMFGSSWDDVRPLPDGWSKKDTVEPFAAQLAEIVRRDFSEAALWGLKDPRMCRLLDVWFPVFEQARAKPVFVHALRSPADVVASLSRRDGFSEEKSRLLWLLNNLSAEKTSRSYPRVFLYYDDLLADPAKELTRVGKALDVAWPSSPEAVAKDIAAFLSPTLRHHRLTPARGAQDADLAQEAFEALLRLKDDPADTAMIDEVHTKFAARIASFDTALLGHLSDIMATRIHLEEVLRDVTASASWRVTKPLRFVQRLAAKVVRSQPENLEPGRSP